MSDNITQWLTEIRTLQRQLADLQKERDQALTSAATWRRLYETEAEQRRLAAVSQSPTVPPAVASLGSLPDEPGLPAAVDVACQEVLAVTSVPELQAKLQEITRLSYSLRQQLEAEQAAHAQTRQTLTTALGDAFDSFKGGDFSGVDPKTLAQSPPQP